MIHNNTKLLVLLSVLLLVQNIDLTLKKSNLKNRRCKTREEVFGPVPGPDPKPDIPDYYPDGYYEFKNDPNYPIPQGVGLVIRHENNSNECVAYNDKSNPWIVANPCNTGNNLEFVITKVGDAFTLTLKHYNKSQKKQIVMDLEGNKTVPREYDPSRKTQLWKFVPRTIKELDEPNNFSIVSVSNGQCLHSLDEHRRLVLRDCDPKWIHEGWWFAPLPKLYPIITDKWIYLRYTDKLKCLYYNSSPAPGYFTNTYCLHSFVNNLLFKITSRGEDTYTITIKGDNKQNQNMVLDSGASVSTYEPGKKTQLWRFLAYDSPEQGKFIYVAKNVGSNQCLRGDNNGSERWVTRQCEDIANFGDSITFFPMLKHFTAPVKEEMRLRFASSTKCLWYHPEGTSLHAASCRHPFKFGLKFVKEGSDTYKIEVTEKKNVKGHVIDQGAVSAKPNGSRTQLWKVVRHPTMGEHGWLRIENAANGECLKYNRADPGNMITGACDGIENADAFQLEVNDRVWMVLNEPYYIWWR